jgi:6-pyruvoyltetrahydropterin/6-carboxytetrahydropterin synthase
MITCTKKYTGFPAAHRQHNHDGHCALIHGHDWAFEFTFAAAQLDDCGFVVDFGKLKGLKDWLNQRFDHTLLLNQDDPLLAYLKRELTDGKEVAKIVVVPNCGAEGLAEWVANEVNRNFFCPGVVPADWIFRQVHVHSLTVFEDEKNSATFTLNVLPDMKV